MFSVFLTTSFLMSMTTNDNEDHPLLDDEDFNDPFSVKLKKDVLRHMPLAEPAYAVLQSYNLLSINFRKSCFDDIFEEGDLSPNSSLGKNFIKRWKWGFYWTPGCGLIVYKLFNKEVRVPPGHVCCFIDDDDNHIFAKPGIHNIQNPFLKQVEDPIAVAIKGEGNRTVIAHGNRTVVTVPIGHLGYAMDMGQPILLPPGLHCWTSETRHFERMYKLDDQPVLQIGPYTVLTVDEGYAAMTINNGKHIILDGGQMHLLTHQKWKFHSFVNMKIQSDEMMELHVNSADNVTLNVDTMVFWKVTDIKSAAAVLMDEKNPTDLSVDTSTDEETSGMSNLRHKVLKQATAVISRFIGNLNFSNAFNKAANLDDSIQQNELNTGHTDSLKPIRTENPIFEHNLIDDFVSDTRNVTAKFGIEILNIIITAAFPLDQEIASAIHGNVMTTADAMREVTLAKSKASVVKIEADATAASNAIIAESEADVVLKKARAEAEADVLRADGLKKADVLRAEGSRQAGNILESSSVAVNLEAMKTSAMAIKNSDKFFFGKEPNYMPKVVMNFNETETA